MKQTVIGIFGGTFDPVHYGHLRTASELQQVLKLVDVRFVPCAVPPLKAAARAPAALRISMLKAAINNYPGFSLDERELGREGPSYTVDTLLQIRQELPDTPLCLIIGMDAWLSFPQWHRWQDILSLAHIVVVHRPGSPLHADGELAGLMKERQTNEAADLNAVLAGRIFVHEVTQLEISSSAIRQLIADGLGANFLLPDEVGELAKDSGCYNRGVS
jgi:nicotinate-nucleotide adenylyltransferase